MFQSIYTTIILNIQKSLGKGSGWVIDSVIDHTISISQYNPLAGSSYILLRKESDHFAFSPLKISLVPCLLHFYLYMHQLYIVYCILDPKNNSHNAPSSVNTGPQTIIRDESKVFLRIWRNGLAKFRDPHGGCWGENYDILKI